MVLTLRKMFFFKEFMDKFGQAHGTDFEKDVFKEFIDKFGQAYGTDFEKDVFRRVHGQIWSSVWY